jgi:HEAT repeat protein/outer membrane murein-binding lipoprotein Lpp
MGLTLLKQDSARGSATCAAGDSPSAAPPTVAANSADSSEELEKLRKDVERLNADNEQLNADNEQLNADIERLRDEVERLRAENKQLNERLRFDPRQAVSEWLSRCMHLQPAGGVAAAAAEEAVAVRETAAESAAGECTFWFVSASHIRSLDLTTTITLPSFLKLVKLSNASGGSVLEQRTLKAGVAYRQGYVSDLLAVSHRWEDPSAPDGAGAQLRAIRAYLDAHPEVVGVWFDFWCMPQGEQRTLAEKVRFKHMLGNVNLLYLGCQVLALIDISYLSRFWTQFEAWLSMQEGSSAVGLRAAPGRRRRLQMVCLHNATTGSEDVKLQRMWCNVTPQMALELLAKPDVTVTNTGDKVTQLEKIEMLDGEVRQAWGVEAARVLRAEAEEEGVAPNLPYGFSEEVLLGAGYTGVERAGVMARFALRDGVLAAAKAFGEFTLEERKAAAAAFGFPMAALAPEVVDALARLEDSDRKVRMAAVSTLGQLDAATLAQHAPALVARIEDSNWHVRRAAVSTLGQLDAATLAQHAPALLALLEDSDSDVREAAVSTLGQLDAATLAQHAPAILARLEHSDSDVREAAVSTLGQLDAATLAQHAPALLARLKDFDWFVRRAAVSTLGQLDAATLAQHAPALEHSGPFDRIVHLTLLREERTAALEARRHGKHHPRGLFGPRTDYSASSSPPARLAAHSAIATIRVTIGRGRELAAKDLGGTSDPFCELWVGHGREANGRYYRTSCKPATLSPTWNESAIFDVEATNELLHLVMFDKNNIMNAHTFMGDVKLDLCGLVPGGAPIEDWFRLEQPASIEGGVTGEVRLTVALEAHGERWKPDRATDVLEELKGTLLTELSAHRNTGALSKERTMGGGRPEDKIAPLARPLGKLRMVIKEARDLIAAEEPSRDGLFGAKRTQGTSDPYCSVHLEQSAWSTTTVEKTCSPQWTQDGPREIPFASIDSLLHVVIFDYDFGKDDDYLGEVLLPLRALQALQAHAGAGELDAWFEVQAPLDRQGELVSGKVRMVLELIFALSTE